jgi:hypothetical protein
MPNTWYAPAVVEWRELLKKAAAELPHSKARSSSGEPRTWHIGVLGWFVSPAGDCKLLTVDDFHALVRT